ncbi:hypothetical protein ACFYN0_34890 [Streptomyces sp. NPDC006704]|uniref:hypothetical protein n=1 Tax=Streptomyces sp. NPDC006704 TaxID=3364760 RepID=UPI003678B929
MPGQAPARSTDRHAAAAHLVNMIDTGLRPTIPAPGDTHTPGTKPGSQAERDIMTPTYRHLVPDLRLSLANLVRASEAMARIAVLGWVPLEGYPGADQPWLMQCRLCGWKGRRFWSHLRGRNGSKLPRPITRHPGCIPVQDMPAMLIILASERLRDCPCEYRHPTTPAAALAVVNRIGTAVETGAAITALRTARAVLEPCPAATARADVLRWAYDRRVKAVAACR